MSETVALCIALAGLYVGHVAGIVALTFAIRRCHRKDVRQYGPKPANFPNPPDLTGES